MGMNKSICSVAVVAMSSSPFPGSTRQASNLHVHSLQLVSDPSNFAGRRNSRASSSNPTANKGTDTRAWVDLRGNKTGPLLRLRMASLQSRTLLRTTLPLSPHRNEWLHVACPISCRASSPFWHALNTRSRISLSMIQAEGYDARSGETQTNNSNNTEHNT